ncbi:MAG: hypothetical protein HY454_02565 [Parcubacteria group bacterium]|nr:hypothetical protein [Parcubacteria group bacterium]
MSRIKWTPKSARKKAVSTPPAPANSCKIRGHKLTTEELLDTLVGLCESCSRPITRDDVKTACHDGIIPSEASIRNHFGAVDIAVSRANKIFRAKCS